MSAPVADSEVFSLAGMRRGAWRGLPFAPGIFVYGLAFGVLSREAGLGGFHAALMSGVVYSGSAQMAALQASATGAGLLVVFATILVINARYFLYGAALRPWLERAKPWQAYGSLLFMVDSSWLATMQVREEGEMDTGFLFGAGVSQLLFWVAGTYFGNVMGVVFANPAALGLDFFLVSFSAAMGAGMLRGRGDFWTLFAAMITAYAGFHLLPTGWTPIAAGLSGAIVAYIRYADER